MPVPSHGYNTDNDNIPTTANNDGILPKKQPHPQPQLSEKIATNPKKIFLNDDILGKQLRILLPIFGPSKHDYSIGSILKTFKEERFFLTGLLKEILQLFKLVNSFF